MRYYFDHNSGTPVDPRVLEHFHRVEAGHPANPASLHTSGRRARAVVEDARQRIADALRVEPDAVLFVSGGTEANNTAVLGAGRVALPVLLAPIEHPSVLAAAELRGTVAWEVDARGVAVVRAPAVPVGLLALVHGQNEVGSLQPVAEAGSLAARLGVPLHVDLSQSLGRCPIDAAVAAATSATLSSHKAGGLRGMAVWIDKSGATVPLLRGGGQQRGRRPGTESPALCAATALAIELALTEQPERARAMAAARDAFLAALDLPGVRCLTPEASLPNTSLLHFADVDGRALLPALDLAGVEASQGSACSSGSPTPPPILAAMGLDAATGRSCVRFSFSQHTTSAHAAEGARVVARVILHLRAR